MRKKDMCYLFGSSAKVFLFQRKRPLFGTLIVTDQCNLSCSHCRLHNYANKSPSYSELCDDLNTMYKKGVRVLCFSGGEAGLWHDGEKNMTDLVKKARETGFNYITVATNGTIPFAGEGSDFILVSIDGSQEVHDRIRGQTYNKIVGNIRKNDSGNIVIFMDINKMNQHVIRDVCELAKQEENIKAVSFNFHTPLKGTEEIALSKQEKVKCVREIIKLMKEGYPILNLKSCFRDIVDNSFQKPCRQLMVMEFGREIPCNRCIRDNICDKCGYFETAEISLLFQGKIKVIADGLITYSKYL